MIKIKLLSPGKIKEPWLESALQEYLKRLSPKATFELVFTKDEAKFYQLLPLEKHLICLDPNGKMFTSEEFSSYFFKTVENQGSEIAFAIGGASGFQKEHILGRPLLSLSKMTLTHQMCRLFLIEQIFRAFEIDKGSAYHK